MAVTLYHLFTDATSFKNLPNGKRIFFVLTYIDPDIITLSGWPTTPSGGGSFDPDPAILLQKAAHSVIIPGNPVYAGNVILDPNDVQNVKRDIASTGATFVTFTPALSSTYPNHVLYIIGLTKDDPATNTNPLIIPTTSVVTANPSPPKAL